MHQDVEASRELVLNTQLAYEGAAVSSGWCIGWCTAATTSHGQGSCLLLVGRCDEEGVHAGLFVMPDLDDELGDAQPDVVQ